jgi:hypothetical protein
MLYLYSMENQNNLLNKNTTSLSSQFSKELLEPSIDLSVDYSEVFIDDLIEDGILKEIPIVKSVVGVIKAGISINQFWFAKKLLTFIREFNTGQIDSEKKIKFQEKINSDLKYRKKVTEQVMVFLDKYLEINKAKVSANLFKAFVEEKLTYDQFISISISLDRLHPESFKFFNEIEKLNYEINHEYEGERNWEAESLILSSGLATETSDWWHGFVLKKEGRLLYELAIKPIL